MTGAEDAAITPKRRTIFASLADAILPGADGMPSATDVAVEGKWLDRVLRARPEIEAALVRILDEARGRDPVEELRRLEREDEPSFDLLLLTTAGAYYMHPKVRKRIGYPGQKKQTIAPDEAEYYLRDELLAPVQQREPLYTPAP